METVSPRHTSCGTALLPFPLFLCMNGLGWLFNGFAANPGHRAVLMKSRAGRPVAFRGLSRPERGFPGARMGFALCSLPGSRGYPSTALICWGIWGKVFNLPSLQCRPELTPGKHYSLP